MTDAITRQSGPTIVIAGSGSGKSVLADQLRALIDRPIVDDATAADLERRRDCPGIVLLAAGRPPEFRERRGELVLRETDLWFRPDEIEQLLFQCLPSDPAVPAIATAVDARTGGWPGAVAAIAQVLGRRTELVRDVDRIATRGRHFAPLFERVLAAVPPAVVAELVELANLPVFSPEFFEHFTSCDSWEDIQRYGLPFMTNPDGFLVLPEAFRARLARRGRLSSGYALPWGRILIEACGLSETLSILIEAQAWDAAQDLVLEVEERSRFREPQVQLFHQLRQIARHTEPRPELLYTVASLSLRQARFKDAAAAVAACIEAADEVGDASTALRARILAATARAHTAAGEISERELDEMAAEQARVGTPRSEIELQKVRVLVLASRGTAKDLAEAARIGQDAAARCAAIGEHDLGAEILRLVAAGPLLDLGRFQDIARLDRMANEMSRRAIPSERGLAFRALALALAGDLRGHQQALGDLRELYGTHVDEWLEAYVWGSRMVVAAFQGGHDGVAYSFQQLMHTIGELAETPSGVVWLALAAEAFAMVGDHERAATILERAQARADEAPIVVNAAAIVVHARAGDPDRATALLRDGIRTDRMPHERQWRAELEIAAATPMPADEKRQRLHEIVDTAHAAGLGAVSRELLNGLLDEDQQPAAVTVTVFGDFQVRTADGAIIHPSGKPSELIKILVLRNGQARVEFLIDALWPEADVASGRRRFKNVLNRARTLLGAARVTRTNDILKLSDDVDSDLFEYRRAVAAAQAAPPTSDAFIANAKAALTICRRGLLPTDTWTEWSSDDRWQVESVAHKLIAELAEVMTTRSDLEWLLDVSAELGGNPFVFERIAAGASAAGLESTARHAAQAAQRPRTAW